MREKKIRTFSPNEKLVEERRHKIITCARQLFVKKGYERTTMRDIGKACRMTSAGIYHYLGKKEDILSMVVNNQYALLYAVIREMEEDGQKLTPVEALTKAIDHYARGLDDNSEDTLFISNNYRFFKPGLRLMVLETVQNLLATMEKIIIKGCQSGDFATDNTWMIAFNCMSIGQMWVLRREPLERKIDFDSYLKFQTQAILNQISTHRR